MSPCTRREFLRASGVTVVLLAVVSIAVSSHAAAIRERYYAHEAVHDRYGVIAPWYRGQNGQCDLRVRIAAETLKRYPWTDTSKAASAVPEFMFNGTWSIGPDGTISIPSLSDWNNGDLGQRAAYVLSGLIDYYRYSGDPAAIALVTLQADMLLDHCLTPSDHAWPGFLMSVPVKGKPYGKCDAHGMIQLDIAAEVGLPLLKAYQLTGNKRYLDAAKHWGDLFAKNCNTEAGEAPWGRYANPEDAPWKDNKQTGGVAFILYFLDELIRLGYTGENSAIVEARDSGRAYMRDVLLPNWTVNDTWGRNYWDWPDPVQAENVTDFAARYMMDNKDCFPNWRNDVRNILSLFLSHTSVDAGSGGEVCSGAWAFPESSGCCGRSLWYGPMELAWPFAQYGVEADSEWGRELARRMQILATYDIHETGVSEDNIDGGQIVCGGWFKIAHPMALKNVLGTMAWLPETLGPSRENHIMRSTSVVALVYYMDGLVHFSTYDAPQNTVTVLRLSYTPAEVSTTGAGEIPRRENLQSNGYTVRDLGGGDCLVSIRHDGCKYVTVRGDDPQKVVSRKEMRWDGLWGVALPHGGFAEPYRFSDKAGASVSCSFTGNQVRLIGEADADGGLADVYLDGVKQLVGIDCWSPTPLGNAVLHYRNGLSNGPHTLKVVVRGERNPRSEGARSYVQQVQYSDAAGIPALGEGGGPKDAQRVIFGYTGREPYTDSSGHEWHPGTEVVTRLGKLTDSVEKAWWTSPSPDLIANTKDPELYRYGIHAPEIIANFTVGPGKYHVCLKFAAVRGIDTTAHPQTVEINGRTVVGNLDVASTAGGPNRAVDLVFNGVEPQNGVIAVRLTGAPSVQDDRSSRGDAFIQALEVGPGNGGTGAKPVTATTEAQ